MLLPLVAVLLAMPVSAQNPTSDVGASYALTNVKSGNHHANVDGANSKEGSKYRWATFKGTAATLTGEGAEYDHYSFSVEKIASIMQSNVFVAP